MSSAQRDLYPLDEASAETEAAPFALREQVAERLAAHRARRGSRAESHAAPAQKTEKTDAGKRSTRIAAAVAERYAQSQSYRAFLAAEAERAIRQAEAEAEAAALNAQAVADAQYQLLEDLDQWALTPSAPVSEPMPEALPAPTLVPSASAASPAELMPNPPEPAPLHQPAPALTVRFYEYEETPSHTASGQLTTSRSAAPEPFFDDEERLSLDEEIAFRQGPTFEPSAPPIEIPANLIEFPRQLVAPRRARPRLAEGPLREDTAAAPETAQLRIFEVEAAQISSAPPTSESVEPEWSSILLSPQPATERAPSPETDFHPSPRPQAAPLSLRLMAASVDACIVVAGFLGFVAAFAWKVNELPPARTPAAILTGAAASAAVLLVLTALYLALFFTFGESTPGMRYARIAFCTLTDDNPTRRAMRRRIFASFLAALPLGLGFLWALLDEDGLGWHDRISRMYQRSY